MAHIVLKLTRSLKFFLRQITIEAEILQENDDDEETRVRFSCIPNIQTTVELKGTGMQGVKKISYFLYFRCKRFFGDSNKVDVTMDKCS